MAAVARFLIDTSAAARMRHPRVAARLAPLIGAGLVATCAALDFEALFAARSHGDYEQIRSDRRLAYEYVATDDEYWQQALGVQRALAAGSRHRSVGLPDLLIAALASNHDLCILHYDSDYDTIGEYLPLAADWVVPRGTVA